MQWEDLVYSTESAAESNTIILYHYPIEILYIADTFTDSTVLSYQIRNTIQSQPSIIIEVKDGDYKELRSTGVAHYNRRGYVIGYRECVSNPSEVCYIFHNDVSMEFSLVL